MSEGRWDPFHSPELATKVFLTLYKANAVAVRRVEERLAPFGLTLARLCLLVALQRAGEPRLPSELGDDLAVTRANISGLLGALEGAGLVRREVDTADRRRMLVHLTPAGAELLRQVWPIYTEAVAGSMGRLSADEQATFLALLQKLGG